MAYLALYPDEQKQLYERQYNLDACNRLSSSFCRIYQMSKK